MKQNDALSPQPDVNSCVLSAEVDGRLVLKGAFVLGLVVVVVVVDAVDFVLVIFFIPPFLHKLQVDLQFCSTHTFPPQKC